jgi:polar amino acid transport system substrate-binding protein
MKNYFSSILIAGLALLPLTTAAEPINLIANTWAPYVDENLPQKGLVIELVSHIYERAGYEPSVSTDTWPRVMEGVSLGLYDAMATIWYTEEREKQFRFSNPYLVRTLKIVKLKSLPGDYFEMAHIEGRRLGVKPEYAYGVDFESIPNLQLVYENRLIHNLLNLLNGKVDFVIGDERVIAMQMSAYLNRDKDKFEILDIELPARSHYMGIGRDHPQGEKRIKEFNAALLASLNDGSYKAIVDKWNQRYGLALEDFPVRPPQ